MKDKIKEILDKFDKVLENYELDKKFGQISVDSICHLFPSEMVTIRNCITNLQKENEILNQNNQAMQEEMARTWEIADDYKLRNEKAIECINYYAIEDDDFNKLYDVEEQELLAILGDKENEK